MNGFQAPRDSTSVHAKLTIKMINVCRKALCEEKRWPYRDGETVGDTNRSVFVTLYNTISECCILQGYKVRWYMVAQGKKW